MNAPQPVGGNVIELARKAVEERDTAKGREILASFLEKPGPDDNTRLKALFYLSQLVESPLEKVECLLKALTVDPKHAKIRAKLTETQLNVIQSAKDAIKSGETKPAAQLLSRLLEIGGLDLGAQVQALFYSSYCSAEILQNIAFLRKALALGPSAAAVRKRLDQLEARLPSQQPGDGTGPEPGKPTDEATQQAEAPKPSARPLPRIWQQPFRDERDIVASFPSLVAQLIERSAGLPDSLEPRIRRLQTAKNYYERAMEQKVPRTSEFIAPAVNAAEPLAEAFLQLNRREDAFWTANMFGEMCKVMVARNPEKYQDVYPSFLFTACCSIADPESPDFQPADDAPELDLLRKRIRSECLDRAQTFFHPISATFRKEAHPNRDLGEHVLHEALARYFDARLQYLLVHDRPRVKGFISANLPIAYKLRLPDDWSERRQNWKKLLNQAGFEQAVRFLEDMGDLINPEEVGQILPEQREEIKRAFNNNDLMRVNSLLTQSAKEIKQALYLEAQNKLVTYRQPARPFLKDPRLRDTFHKVQQLIGRSDPEKLADALGLMIEMAQYDIENLGLREWVAYLYAVTNNRPAAEGMFQDIRKRRTNPQQGFLTDWNLAVLAWEAKDERTAYQLLVPLLDADVSDADLANVVLALSLRLEDRERFLTLLSRTKSQRYAPLGFVVAYELENKPKQQEFLAQLLRGWQSSWEFPASTARMTEQDLSRTVGRAIIEGQLDPLVLWLHERIEINPNWVPNYLKLAWVLENEKQDYDGAFQASVDRLKRPKIDKSQDYVDRASREMFDLCRRRKRLDLGQRAYRIASDFRPSASKELLESYSMFAASRNQPPAPTPTPPPPLAPPTVYGERIASDEKLLWVTARLSGIRTVQKYVQESQAIDELMKILTQMSPQESPTVVDLIQKFSQAVSSFSNTPSEVLDSRRFLYGTANGIAKRFDKLFTGAMPQRLADMLTPYHQAVEQVLGDLSKQASVIPTLQASIDNPFISLDAERSTLVMRIKNSSDRPVTDIVANLLVENSPVSVIGSRECSIAKLEAQQSQFFNFPAQRSHLGADGNGVTEAGFSISLKASAEGFEDIDLGIKKQVIKVVRTLSEVIGKDRIPKRFLIGAALDSKNSELFQGRDDDMKKVRGSLENGTQSERYFLDGIRRVGKTSILKMLPSFLPDKIIPVYFNFEDTDLGQPGSLNSWKILQDFCFKLNASSPTGSLPAVPDPANFQTEPGRTFRSYLESVKTALPGRVPLFMFDEFPDLLNAVARSGGGMDRETLVLDQLRGLLDSGDLNAIFTGSMRFDSLSDVLAHRILGSLTPLRVSFLKKENVGQVLRAGMAEWITIPPETIDSVFEQSGGYPWFVQMYGSFLVDLMNIERRAIATPGDVATVTREQILPTSANFEYWWPPQLESGEERFVERLFREYPDTECVPRDQFFENINFREQGEFKRAFENLRACEVLDSDKADVLRIRGAALRQWLKTRMFDGRLRIERSSSKREALSQAGLFIDHENLIAALEEVAKAHGSQVPFGQEKVAWLSSILKHLVDEATRRVGTLTCRVAVAFWDRTAESRLQTAYHHHDFQLKQPEEIKMGNAVDFKLVTEVHRAQQQATKEGARLEHVIIVSGDGDYAHLARALKNEGVTMQIWAGSKSVNSGYREIIGRENVVLLDDVCGL